MKKKIKFFIKCFFNLFFYQQILNKPLEKDEHLQDFEKVNQLWLNERVDKDDLKNKGQLNQLK